MTIVGVVQSFVVAYVLDVRLGGPPHATPTPASTFSEQLKYQATVQEGRSELFEGRLYATTDRTEKVAEWFMVRILLCGPASPDSDCRNPGRTPTPGALPDEPLPTQPAGDVLLGGRVSVHLSATDDAVVVKDPGFPEERAQPLTDPADRGEWFWDVFAKKPGTHTLRVTVFAFAADTDKELVPRETLFIRLKAERTSSYTAGQLQEGGLSLAQFLIPLILTFVAALATARVITFRRRRSRQADQNPPSETPSTPSAVSASPTRESPRQSDSQ